MTEPPVAVDRSNHGIDTGALAAQLLWTRQAHRWSNPGTT